MQEALYMLQRPDFLPQLERRGFMFIQKRLPVQAIFPSQDTEKIASGLYLGLDNFTQSAWDIFRENMHIYGDEVFLSANKVGYPDMWFRDSMYAMEFVDDPRIEAKILRSFEKRQKENGQILTGISKYGSAYWLDCDDEVTMLYLIWSAKLTQRTNGEYKPDLASVRNALKFIRNHVENDKYYSEMGDRKGWLDAFRHEGKTVITQNQGLYAVSLLAAQTLEKYLDTPLFESKDNITGAINEYRRLAQFGYLPFSDRHPYATDASVLYPEYLAMTIFGPEHKMLDRNTVERTVNNLPVKDGKVMILAQSPAGDYFAPSSFIPYRKEKNGPTLLYQEGEYQNGGFWPYWTSNAMLVGRLHGIEFQEKFREIETSLYEQLTRFNWPECVNLDNNILRPRQLWNLGILGQQRNVFRMLNAQNL